MSWAEIPLGQHAPDSMDLGVSGSAKNAIPKAKVEIEGINGTIYTEFNDLSVETSALDAYCRGFTSGTSKAGVEFTFAGSLAKLEQLSDNAWTDVTRTSGGSYALATATMWHYANFNDQIIAVALDEVTQEFTLASSTDFAALAGSPPTCKTIAAFFRFVVAGHVAGTPYRVQWSQIDSASAWAASPANQSGQNDLHSEGGKVQKIHPLGSGGIIMQEQMIHRMDYVGGSVVFHFSMADKDRGLWAEHASAIRGGRIFYLSEDGFYMWTGGESVAIGADRVNDTFLSDVDPTNSHRIVCVTHPVRPLTYWFYPGAGANSNSDPNKVLIYNWHIDRWAIGEIQVEFAGRRVSAGYTLDGLDAAFGTDIDDATAYPVSWDSRRYAGGTLSLGGIDTAHKLGSFDGSPLTAEIDTPEVRLTPTSRSEVQNIEPTIDGGTHSVAVGTRETQAGTVAFTSSVSENTDGICPILKSGRYHRFRASISGGFKNARGVNVEYDDAGEL